MGQVLGQVINDLLMLLMALLWTLFQAVLQAAIILVGVYYGLRLALNHHRVGAPMNPLHVAKSGDGDDSVSVSAVTQPE